MLATGCMERNSAKILALVVPVFLGLAAPFGAVAMTIGEAGPPANMPPAGFKGLEFIDSRGCYYIQTGGADAPNWVPRVTRKGQVICGLTPTFSIGDADKKPS